MSKKNKVDNNFELAVNALESSYRSARAGFFNNLGMGGNTKYSKLWREAGYPESITPTMLYQMYTRDGLGHGIISKLMNLVWETNPIIVDGDRDKNQQKKETSAEIEIKKWANKIKLWSVFKLADAARSACEYAGVIMYVKDGLGLDKPIDGTIKLEDIEGFRMVWQHELTVADRNQDRNSIDYQKPASFNYIEYKPDGVSNQNTHSSSTATIDATRVFLLGDVYGIGANSNGNRVLVPIYNNLVGLQQIDAAGTSGTVKAAAQHMTWNYENSNAMSDIAKQYGVKIEKLQEVFQTMVERVNTSMDSALITSGAQISTLDVNMPDLDQARNGHENQISSGTGIAYTELTGHQTGERASTENSSSTRRTAKSRQEEVETNDVNDFFMWLQGYGLWAGLGLQCVWNDLLEPTLSEKLTNVGLMADANQKMSGTGGVVFTVGEMRTTADFEPEPELSQFEKQLAKDGDKMNDLPEE